MLVLQLVPVLLVWLEILPICVHSRLVAEWPPPYFTFQQVAPSPQQCQDAACQLPAQTLLASPPATFITTQLGTASQPSSLKSGKAGEDFICVCC